jgi:D-alanyl-D-alanine carboxypeptidase/D-alanyl-D-alanine-endopeptidase (penicillin-binding protein 4)
MAQAAEPSSPVLGPDRQAVVSPVDARIKAKLSERARASILGRDLAITVTDPQTKRVVFASQATEGQLPASNAKVVTAYAALSLIGPNARTTTRVVANTSATRLTIVGAGDPMLTNAKLDALAANVVRNVKASAPGGVLPSSAKVLVDDTLFAPPSNATGWRSTYVPSQVNPVASLQRFGSRTSRPISDAGNYFAARLSARGLKAAYVGRARAGSAATLATVQGFPMGAIVQRMLLSSDNNIAEVVARRAALASGRSATWAGWQATARAALVGAGVSVTNVRVVDGSGLSRATRLPARTLTSLVVRASTSSRTELAGFMDRFPVAGVSGTLGPPSRRYTTSPTACAAGKVKAKTGTLSGVYALSGVAIARDGRPRAFSFVANGVPSTTSARAARAALDRLAATVVGCF